MNKKILHGLEFELQLMIEVKGTNKIVEASKYFNWDSSYLPENVLFDMGNIEINSIPCDTYFKAVENANNTLIEKLVPALINKYKLQKFALFLPVPMCMFYYENGEFDNFFSPHDDSTLNTSCLKHWNISYNNIDITNNINRKLKNEDYAVFLEKYSFYKDMAMLDIKKNWKYNYNTLESKKYPLIMKDLDSYHSSRVHIKIPYHYVPPQGNPDLMPDFLDTLIPPDKWKSLVGYCRNGHWTTIRKLV